MDDRTWWTWVMRGFTGLVRMIVAAAGEYEGIPAGVAVELKEGLANLQTCLEHQARDS